MGIEDHVNHLHHKFRLDHNRPNDKFRLDDKFIDLIEGDEKEKFILEICQRVNQFSSQSQQILCEVLFRSSVKCAEALITGQTPLTVDLNLPCNEIGMYPLHFFAFGCTPSVIELLICYGAQTNIRLTPCTYKGESYVNMLPLQIALQTTTEFYYLSTWNPKHSIYKLVSMFCLPRLQNRLEAIGLLAGMTKETEEVFLEYAVQGKIIEFAALLMVAHKKLNNVMHIVRQCFDSIENNNPTIGENQKEKVASMEQLVEVFERAGDDISTYLKEDKFYVSKYQTIADVTRLLVEAGFQLQQSDADLSRYMWFEDTYDTSNQEAPYEDQRCLDDFGMAHYSKSGYRWKVSKKDPWWRFCNVKAYINELKNEVEGLKVENVNIKKKQQQPNLRIWMDDELGKALEEDDREQFLSVIDRKLDFFHSRQQQLLYVVCGSGSIKCAEALLNGDTCLTVELNHPCTDTGMYPLHCAALSLFPSIVELFLYSGARTDIRFTPCNPSDIYPHYLLEAHANKLPLHMALLGISRLPCIREWSPKHTIAKLVTLLCLPRMQNPLETLGLLAGTTREIQNEYIDLAMNGKVVELAAMHIAMVANEKFHDIKEDVYYLCMSFKERSMLDKDQTQKIESVLCLLKVFDEVGYDIVEYVKEDKYNVTKYQAIEDVACMLQGTFPLEPSDTDLSVYSWYRDEEPSYPSEAPYENVRLLHDVGMEHYFRSGYRWKVSEKEMYTWRSAKTKAYIKEMENQIERLTEENAKEKKQLQKVLKPAAFRVPYILCQGVPIASSGFFSPDAMKPKEEHKMRRTMGTTSSRNLQIFLSKRTITSTMALLFKRIMKHK